MYKKAFQQKLRFDTPQGKISVEDLFDLPLSNLNILAKSLNRKIKENEEEDYISDKSANDTKTKLLFDLVIDVINTKKASAEASEKRASKADKKKLLLDLLNDKEHEELRGLSKEDLLKQIEEL